MQVASPFEGPDGPPQGEGTGVNLQPLNPHAEVRAQRASKHPGPDDGPSRSVILGTSPRICHGWTRIRRGKPLFPRPFYPRPDMVDPRDEPEDDGETECQGGLALRGPFGPPQEEGRCWWGKPGGANLQSTTFIPLNPHAEVRAQRASKQTGPGDGPIPMVSGRSRG